MILKCQSISNCLKEPSKLGKKVLMVFGPPGLRDSLTVFFDSSLKNFWFALKVDQMLSANKVIGK